MSTEATNGTTVSFGAVIRRYLAEEIPKRPSTASRYRCWLKNHVEPKWRDYPIEQIKPLLVEDWLKKLNLAPKSGPLAALRRLGIHMSTKPRFRRAA